MEIVPQEWHSKCSPAGQLLTIIIGVKTFQIGQKADTSLHAVSDHFHLQADLCVICLHAAQNIAQRIVVSKG